ncbi:unnamed protein product, partial [Larinioides sclopetarius]
MKKHGDCANHDCFKCPIKVYRMEKLQDNMRTHFREKTYSCEKFYQEFMQLTNLLRYKGEDHSTSSTNPRIVK